MIKPKTSIAVIPMLLLADCLAKTIRKDNGSVEKGVSVLTHCLISGYVARELINRQPDWLKKELFPSGSELVTAVHDAGKICPTFQEKIYRDLGQVLNLANPELDKTIGYHSTVSQVAVYGVGRFIPEIVGRHHGFSPQMPGLPNDEQYGGAEWQKQRERLIETIKETLRVNWPTVVSSIHADVLSGLTCVADWISSGTIFSKTFSAEHCERLVSQALDLAGFIQPHICTGLLFENVFTDLSGKGLQPREIQTALIRAIKTPGIYVLEAPMGVGKTEAALYAAYRAMEENRATGIYFALPTKLTSDKMYDRMNKFLDVILSKEDANRESLLLHGSAWLRKTNMGEEGQPGGAWFDSGKRGLLAPFAVGTIDQALMAAMNVKHGFVRTFGLAGKVVILDEVHSYDSYTGTLLEELVEVLREIHCTVIILSATLTENQRKKLLCDSDTASEKILSAYPLISAAPIKQELLEYPVESIEKVKTDICIIENDVEAIEEVLLRAERGEQVLWIENTVKDAQKVYTYLAGRASEIGVKHGLLHSRFLKSDREKNEKKWVEIFGKEGQKDRQSTGRILVGTQVLEQSLDIDADFLVTRLCPTDMLFQRIGRLWRHRENDPVRPAESKRETWILSPSLEDALTSSQLFGKSEKVYSPYVLCRTLEVWQNITSIVLPSEIRTLLEATYLERDEIRIMAGYKYKMQKERDELRSHALIGVSRGGKTVSDNNATTRYSELPSVEVLLIRSKRHDKNGEHLCLLDGAELTILHTPQVKDIKAWKSTAVELQRNTVCVPEYNAPCCSIKSMEWLKEYVYLGNDDEQPSFRIAIVQADGELIGLNQEKPLAGYKLCYDSTLGYVAEKL